MRILFYNKCLLVVIMIYGYIRVSSAGQAGEDKTSLPEQERKIEAAAMVIGKDISRVFKDPGISGGLPISQRPEGGHLWEIITTGDTLIAAKLDRLFRNLADAAQVITDLASREIDLICVDMGLEPVGKSATGRLLLYVQAMFADFEREQIRERTWAGKMAAQGLGRHVAGSPPRGFENIGGYLVPNAEYAAMSEAYKMYKEGCDIARLADIVEKMGLKSRTGNRLRPTQIERSLVLWDKLPPLLITN